MLLAEVGISVLIICKFSNKWTCTRKKEVEGLSCGFEVEEIAFVGVIAVAKHGFAAEVLPIVLQLAFDVLQLRVELILLRHLSGVEIFVCHEKRLIE